MRAIVAVAALNAFWPLERAAYAQAGAEKSGAGGAPAAGDKAAGDKAGAEKAGTGGGQEGAEKSGEGGAAPAGDKATEKGGEKQGAAVSAETKVVIYVEGPKAAEVKADIEKSLPAGVTAVPSEPFAESLKAQGLVPLAKNIKGPRERDAAAAKLQPLAQQAGVQAVIVATAPAAKGGKFDIAILIVPSDSPQPLASTNVKAATKDNQKRAEAIAGVISPAISGIIPIVSPAAAEPAKAEEAKAEEAKAEEPKAEEAKAEEKKPEEAGGNNFLKGKYLLEAGLGTQGRSFFYILPPGLERGNNVRDYDILAAPHLFVHADWYPFAGPGDSFVNNIGLTAIAGGAVGLKSTLRDLNGQQVTGVKTNFFHFRIGPKVRFPLGQGDKAPLFTGEVAYSRWGFTFDDPDGTSPSFIYQSVRPGVGLRLPAGPVTLLFETGAHFVTNAGELDARFPNAGVLGLDLQAGVAVPFSPTFEGRFALNYNRYRGNLKAELDQNADLYTGYVAAGSVDQFFGLHVGVAIAP
jgi:hypothetical protein